MTILIFSFEKSDNVFHKLFQNWDDRFRTRSKGEEKAKKVCHANVNSV